MPFSHMALFWSPRNTQAPLFALGGSVTNSLCSALKSLSALKPRADSTASNLWVPGICVRHQFIVSLKFQRASIKLWMVSLKLLLLFDWESTLLCSSLVGDKEIPHTWTTFSKGQLSLKNSLSGFSQCQPWYNWRGILDQGLKTIFWKLLGKSCLDDLALALEYENSWHLFSQDLS